jgi:hypothetical protein
MVKQEKAESEVLVRSVKRPKRERGIEDILIACVKKFSCSYK